MATRDWSCLSGHSGISDMPENEDRNLLEAQGWVFPELGAMKKKARDTFKDRFLDYDCFFSFDWGIAPEYSTYNQIKEIHTNLQLAGLNTCFDKEDITSNIDRSAIVVCFVTKKYMLEIYSTISVSNCNLEFHYASRRKTQSSIIIVVLEAEMRNTEKWIGPLSSNLSGSTFIDFTDSKKSLSDKCQSLVEEAHRKGLCNRVFTTAIDIHHQIDALCAERVLKLMEPIPPKPVPQWIVDQRVEANYDEEGVWIPGVIR